ncbi:hypothetical protein HK102_007229, partial [Quaeritorhiza haematococci]
MLIQSHSSDQHWEEGGVGGEGGAADFVEEAEIKLCTQASRQSPTPTPTSTPQRPHPHTRPHRHHHHITSSQSPPSLSTLILLTTTTFLLTSPLSIKPVTAQPQAAPATPLICDGVTNPFTTWSLLPSRDISDKVAVFNGRPGLTQTVYSNIQSPCACAQFCDALAVKKVQDGGGGNGRGCDFAVFRTGEGCIVSETLPRDLGWVVFRDALQVLIPGVIRGPAYDIPGFAPLRG